MPGLVLKMDPSLNSILGQVLQLQKVRSRRMILPSRPEIKSSWPSRAALSDGANIHLAARCGFWVPLLTVLLPLQRANTTMYLT